MRRPVSTRLDVLMEEVLIPCKLFAVSNFFDN